MSASGSDVGHAYRECLNIARSHYENFPVASWLLPRRTRLPVAAIYAFARRADDFADEHDLTDAQRLDALRSLGQDLDAAVAGAANDDAVLVATADAIRRHHLPLSLFHDLLDAFRQDVTKKRYADFGELMQYCRRSANPVGRLLLHLTNEATERNLGHSDAICSALQLINFYQDLRQDFEEMGRIYLPQDEMQRFGVTEAHIARGISDLSMRRLMQFQYQRADQLLRSGAPLGRSLGGRFGLEIRMIVIGGARVLHHLKKQDADLYSRPRLDARDAVAIVLGALFPRRRKQSRR